MFVSPTAVGAATIAAGRAGRRVVAGADQAALLVVVEGRLDRAGRVGAVDLVPAEHRPDLLQVHVLAHVGVVARAVGPVARVHRRHRREAAGHCRAGWAAAVRRDRRRVVVAREHHLLAGADRAGDRQLGVVQLPAASREEMVTRRDPEAELAVRLRGVRRADALPPVVELLRAVVVLRQVVAVAGGAAAGGTGGRGGQAAVGAGHLVDELVGLEEVVVVDPVGVDHRVRRVRERDRVGRGRGRRGDERGRDGRDGHEQAHRDPAGPQELLPVAAS